MSTVGRRAADGNALDPEIGDVRSHPKPWKGRPWKTKVLSEADLDVELENETVGDEHGHSHVVGHGKCHGFDEELSGWFHVSDTENVFVGTAFGRRIIPLKRAFRVRRRIYAAFFVSGAYAVAEIVAAVLSGSTALFADAAHMFSDFISYGLSIFIIWLTLRDIKRDEETRAHRPTGSSILTYGISRLEVLGALGIIIVVWIATFALVISAGSRLSSPPEVNGRTIALTALGGLVVDTALLFLLRDNESSTQNSDSHGHSHSSHGHSHASSRGHSHGSHGHSHGTGELSSRAMFVHIIGDLAGTIVIFIGGMLIWTMGDKFAVVDPICTFIFGALVTYTTFPFAKRLVRTLMEAAPPGLNVDTVANTIIEEVPGIVGVHCLHLWEISPEKVALTAHVHVDVKSSAIVRRGNQIVGLDPDLQALEEALRRATHVCNKRFGIRHVTIQMTAIPEQGGLATCGKVGKTVDTCNGCS